MTLTDLRPRIRVLSLAERCILIRLLVASLPTNTRAALAIELAAEVVRERGGGELL